MSDENQNQSKVPVYTLGSADPRTIIGGENYSKGYHAFSAVDVKVSLEKGTESTVYAEIQAVSAAEDLVHGGVSGTIVAIVFDKDPLREWVGKTFDIVLRASSEYGDRATSVIKDARFSSISWGVSIDDLVMEVCYNFEAKSCTGFLPLLPLQK